MPTEVIKITLPDGYQLNFEADQHIGEQEIGNFDRVLNAEEITKTIEGTVQLVRETFERVKPNKASVKFGVKVVMEPGHLAALIVRGSGEGNLEITLEWAR